jgi:hypothetical protein
MPDVPNVPATPAPAVVPANPAAAKPTAPEVKASADPKATPAVKAITPAEKEVISKIKVGDTEYDEAVLKSLIEKSKGADKKFLEAAQARKEAMRFFKLAKENPAEFLRKTGLDPKKFAYDEVAADVKNKLRDPKEVALEEAQKRLKEFEAKETAEKERKNQEKLDKQAKAAEAKLHQDIIEALEVSPALPKNAFTVAKIAKYLQTVLDKTGEMLSPKDVVKVMERDLRGELQGVVKGASAEQLLELIGEEGLATLRAFDLARLKDPLNKGEGGSPDNPAKPEKKRYKNSHEYWKSIDAAAKAEREARGQ